MFKKDLLKLKETFVQDHGIFWNNLSRWNNLMVIINITMFFLTGLVAQGYYFTFYSLICLSIVGMGILLPLPHSRSLKYYGGFLVIELAGIYFLVASVVYWVKHRVT